MVMCVVRSIARGGRSFVRVEVLARSAETGALNLIWWVGRQNVLGILDLKPEP
jgi:hypothetical protein